MNEVRVWLINIRLELELFQFSYVAGHKFESLN